MSIWGVSLSKAIKLAAIIFILAFLLLVSFAFYYIYDKEAFENKYDTIIISASKKYNIDPNLVKAVIWKESDFNPVALGTKKERGLMQIMEKHAVQDWANYKKCQVPPPCILFSPEVNIDIGTWYLARCLSHWDNYEDSLVLAIAEYNAGYKRAKEWASKNIQGSVTENITFPSTKKYVISILKKYKTYKTSSLRLKD
ncbi:MAG TPA: murein transglycosylase [Lentisphaeria bacterium]|nr:MAG: hypothetical protein A2X47_07345 [Lentisphaerae bacterium GWF2_38_69]HBM15554.1 murein transglycosylase [Lentisphaeria bacterium]